MNTKPLNNWAGLISIVWLLGGFALIAYVLAPRDTQFEPLWLLLVLILGVWLGVGLLLAIAGLKRGNWLGRILAAIAICLFIYFAWLLVRPLFFQDRPARNVSVAAIAP
jgi:hypothetical protein